jgi:hypothetical protein
MPITGILPSNPHAAAAVATKPLRVTAFRHRRHPMTKVDRQTYRKIAFP